MAVGGVAVSDILGKPIVIYPHYCQSCLGKIVAFLSFLLVRLLFAGGFFALGYGCAVMRGNG